MGLATAADLRGLPRAALEARFGPRLGGFLFDACRGEDASTVVASGPPKAITVEDSFKSCTSAAAAEHVLAVLAPDLVRGRGRPGRPAAFGAGACSSLEGLNQLNGYDVRVRRTQCTDMSGSGDGGRQGVRGRRECWKRWWRRRSTLCAERSCLGKGCQSKRREASMRDANARAAGRGRGEAARAGRAGGGGRHSRAGTRLGLSGDACQFVGATC